MRKPDRHRIRCRCRVGGGPGEAGSPSSCWRTRACCPAHAPAVFMRCSRITLERNSPRLPLLVNSVVLCLFLCSCAVGRRTGCRTGKWAPGRPGRC